MKKKPQKSKTEEFREELNRQMPGYAWTIHRSSKCYGEVELTALAATGIQSAGMNRLSTLKVVRQELDDRNRYYAKSSGFGVRAPWLHEAMGNTLAQALRALQDYYEYAARKYSNHAHYLEMGRQKKESDTDG